MRFLFVTGGGDAPVHSGVPLAWAARTAGHEVLVTAPAENVGLLTGVGLPARAVTETTIVDAMIKDRDGNHLELPTEEDQELDFAGRGFGRLSAAQYPATAELAEAWRPDVVIGGEYNLAAQLVARRCGIPLVRHTWAPYAQTDVDWQGATRELRPELAELGLTELPEHDLFVDITPPRLRPDHAIPAQAMRWTPGNRQAPLEPWMYTAGDRPRVLLTSGSRSAFSSALGIDFFRPLLDSPVLSRGAGDVEVVVATAEPVAAELRAEYPRVHAGYVPLEVVAPTADVAVHHGGGVTVMTLLNAGVPQVVLPEMESSATPMRPVDAFGASITFPPDPTRAGDAAAAVGKVLSDGSFRRRAGELAAEIAAMPSTFEVVQAIEALAH